MASDTDFDPQDQAEVFDEDNQSLDGAGDSSADMKTLEELPDVIDVTSAVGDADDDAALIGEELDDDEIIALEEDGDSTDIEDDELAARMPEAFDDDSMGDEDIEEVGYDGEAGLDTRDDLELTPSDASEFAVSRAPGGDAELTLAEDVDDVTDLDGDDSAVAESDRLADDDIADLGYPGDETARHAREGRPDQNR